jgi:hypothetical protein
MLSGRYSCQVLIKLKIFSTDFRKILQYQTYRKILSVEAELFLADGRMGGQTDTYVTKLIVAFRNCANAPRHYIP